MKKLLLQITVSALLAAVAAMTGCAENVLVLTGPGTGIRPEGPVKRIDLERVRREHPEFFDRFTKAVKIIDGFIRERPFFKSGFDVEKPSLELRKDRLYFNGEEVLLARGSLVITLGTIAGLVTHTEPHATASPGRVSFRVFGSGDDSNVQNSLFYDKYRKDKFVQESNELRMATLLCHELVHVVQFRRDGAPWYYTAYTLNFVFNLFNPLTYFGRDAGPYRQIGYEIEARKYERALYHECRTRFERSLEGKPDAP